MPRTVWLGAGHRFFLDPHRRDRYNRGSLSSGISVVTVRESFVFSFFDPRVHDLVLGLVIGLSLALAWHWVAWTIH